MPPDYPLGPFKWYHKLIIASKKGIGALGGQRDVKTIETELWTDLQSHMHPQVGKVWLQDWPCPGPPALASVPAGALPARAGARFSLRGSFLGPFLQ